MSNLLSQLSSLKKNKPIEPREIFMSLPKNKYGYARDVQTEVWKKWYEQRDQKNSIIKMNTGSGKTIVGLLILQSCLNESKGPAIYVVPDSYLAQQVCSEAKALGILAVTDRDDYNCNENNAILVTTIHALINGRSVFGMRGSNNYPIGCVLLDDVHACLDIITSQFSIKIPSDHELYGKMIETFADSWKSYDHTSYINIVEMKDYQKIALLPFWIWQNKKDPIFRLLKMYDNPDDNNNFIYFNLPLLQDCLSFCSCVITADSIEITPKGTPISKIASFENATRRIFMSATLSDDSVFVSAVGLKKDDIADIITPEEANDIGDRLILFPKHLNSSISDEQIKEKVFSIAEEHNVVVIVPSFKRAAFWDSTGQKIAKKDNIAAHIEGLKNRHIGLVVFVSRYDGIDLPDDACRLLVIDGLPPLRSKYEKYVQSVITSGHMIIREQMQRIEQGMGRGVRSSTDSCCIVLMGNELADVLLRSNGVSHFSNTTMEQYNLSKDLWGLLIKQNATPDIDEIFEMANYSLNRSDEWVQESKNRLSNVKYETKPNISEVTIALREAFEEASINSWTKAVEALDNMINKETDKKTKGYLMQIKAEYTNFIDISKAQQILLAARKCNSGTLIPIEGIQYEKLLNKKIQAKALIEYVSKLCSNSNEYIVHIDATLDSLTFSPEAHEFERALEEFGKLLGFNSSRFDNGGNGPDNLWAVGDGEYFVIECKSGAIVETIAKKYCDQLGGSIRWFNQQYGSDLKVTPVMVHKSQIIDDNAAAVEGMRIITPELLDSFKEQFKNFTTAFVQDENWGNVIRVSALLSKYKLCSNDILNEYSSCYIKSKFN